jgi:hypothetical protein
VTPTETAPSQKEWRQGRSGLRAKWETRPRALHHIQCAQPGIITLLRLGLSKIEFKRQIR